jgi:hypothetical protein
MWLKWKCGKSRKGAEPTGDDATGKHYFALYEETRNSKEKPSNSWRQVLQQFGY